MRCRSSRGQRGGSYWFAPRIQRPAMLVWALSTTAAAVLQHALVHRPRSTPHRRSGPRFRGRRIAAAILYPLSLRCSPSRATSTRLMRHAVPTQAAAPSQPIESTEAVAGDRGCA
jgi:hypothetical protein